ncbi:vWA domain-containing protein [Methanoculleus sp.]|jgi:Ca-activated chloride channel family protein|uniref:vWA domain-containing protein n=1 Tax=Methanoculleus sp. TaxID=90427 RepID=UPI002FC82688
MTGFAEPFWLVGLAGIPVLYLLYRRAVRERSYAALTFSRVAVAAQARDPDRLRRPHTLFALALLALALILVGLADPQIPLEGMDEGVSVVLVLDTSGSMQATDYQPTRLEAAKAAAGILLSRLNPDDYAGIVIFESGATSAAYLSPDRDRVIERLYSIRGRDGSTALGDGLALGVDMADSIPNRHRVVILLSDGAGNAGTFSAEEAAAYARERSVPVYTVGIGSANPLAGTSEHAALDEETLRAIARTTGGKYYAAVDEGTLAAVYAGLTDEIPREPKDTSIRDVFFVGALAVLLLEMYLRYGRGRILP